MARGTILTRTAKDGKRRYTTVIRINGRQQWKTWDRKADAESYLDELSPDIRDKTYREIKTATFREYADHYKKTHLIPERFKPQTFNGYCSILGYHLIPEFGKYPMQAISAAEINRFSAKLLQAGKSVKTARNVLTLLGEILSKAVQENYLKVSPMAGVDKPKMVKEHEGRALKPDEIQTILQACDEDFRLKYVTAIATGMRRGEQFGLDWEHVDFDHDVIQVRRALVWKFGKYYGKAEGETSYGFVAPKSKKSTRDIDMSPALRKELRALYLRSGRKGLVFCTSKGTPINPENMVKREFRAALDKTEVERKKGGLPAIGKVRWHDLRHTYGSLKIDQGEDVLYVSRQMGHSSLQVTAEIYAHQIRERRPEAAAKTDAAIFGDF